ncbi:hypothetical protein ACS0TY_012997 [Phlomoides rotata]
MREEEGDEREILIGKSDNARLAKARSKVDDDSIHHEGKFSDYISKTKNRMMRTVSTSVVAAAEVVAEGFHREEIALMIRSQTTLIAPRSRLERRVTLLTSEIRNQFLDDLNSYVSMNFKS